MSSKLELVENELGTKEKEASRSGSYFGIRHVQIALMFFLCFASSSIRGFLSVAIVAMTDPTTSSNPDIPTYEWDNKNTILSSYLWGTVTLEFVSGHVATKYGPKVILTVTMVIGGILTSIIPITAQHFGSIGLITIRALAGASLSFIFSSLMVIISRWVPINERSTLSSVAMAGFSISSIVTGIATSYISASQAGWPVSCYVWGILCFAWVIVWYFFGSNSPEEDTKISDEEKLYILSSLGQEENAVIRKTPWKEIFTSVPVWALIIASVGNAFILNMFIAETPTYMKSVLGIDLETSSLLNTINSSIGPTVGFLAAIVADRIIHKNIVSISVVRRVSHLLGTIVPSVLCFILGFIPQDETALAVAAMIILMIFFAFCINSNVVNYMDLTTNFAGVIMGVANELGALVSIFAPLLVQFIVKDETDIKEWRIVLMTTASICAFSSIIYIIFLSGEKQPWNEISEDDKEEKKRNK